MGRHEHVNEEHDGDKHSIQCAGSMYTVVNCGTDLTVHCDCYRKDLKGDRDARKFRDQRHRAHGYGPFSKHKHGASTRCMSSGIFIFTAAALGDLNHTQDGITHTSRANSRTFVSKRVSARARQKGWTRSKFPTINVQRWTNLAQGCPKQGKPSPEETYFQKDILIFVQRSGLCFGPLGDFHCLLDTYWAPAQQKK